MTNFRFVSITPHLLLKPFVGKMWMFETDGRLPELENRDQVTGAITGISHFLINAH